MELIFCHIESFGTLRDKTARFHPGLNALRLDNGKGKTTLLAFIRCMLYGLSDGRSRDELENDRKHYAPWQGGCFGGSLVLKHGEKTYRLVRRFGARPADDLLQVFDEQTGAPSGELGLCPGLTLLGMDESAFLASSVFSERPYETGAESESLIARMGEQTGEAAQSASAALARLADLRRIYEKRGGKGLVAETEAALATLEAKRAAILPEAEALSQREAAYLCAKERLAALTRAEQKEEKGKKKRPRPSLPLLISGLALLLASALLCVLSPYAIIGALPSLVLLISSFFSKKEKNYLHNSGVYELSADGRRQTEERYGFEEFYAACTAAERSYLAACDAKRELESLDGEIEEMKRKREKTALELSDIQKTQLLLTEAAKRYREEKSAETHAHFSTFLDALGTQNAEDFRLDDGFRVQLLSGGAYHSARLLSRGGKDTVTLSRSLALREALPSEARAPLLLDDPFLSYDDGRVEQALAALSSLGKKQQVIYLTCSHSRMP